MSVPGARPVALVTGAARRIGAAIAEKLHREGYRLAIHYRSSDQAAEALVARFNDVHAHSAVALQADLTHPDTPEALVAQCLNEFGQLNALVNNASAFFPTPMASPARHEEWDMLLNVNLRAPFLLAHAARPHLVRCSGVIINLIDLYAERPLGDHPVYVASKAGLAGLTRALARDLGSEGVRVNGIAPGAILWPDTDNRLNDTSEAHQRAHQKTILDRTPLGTLGAASDIADTAYFLIHEAPFINGQILSVDGGRSVMP